MHKIPLTGSMDMEYAKKKKLQKTFWEGDDLNKRRKPSHPVIRAFVEPKITEIKKYTEVEENSDVLELGAGNGFFSFYLENICKLTVTDYSKKMIELNPAKRKRVMDASNIEFEDNSFDIVFESNLLHHVIDIDRVISEMKRVSKKYLVFIEPNRNNPLMFLFGLLKKVERNSLRFSLRYMIQLATNKGLKVVSSTTMGAVLPNKTPNWLLPILKKIDGESQLWFYNIVIAEKLK
jgi:SAM-dependent methyltransferase